MKIAAYQAPLLPSGSTDTAINLIREQVRWCESAGVEILCCPEGVLGGLADDVPDPNAIAIAVDGRQLEERLSPLASDRVTTIVGFTEIDASGLFNAAAVFEKGSVAGVYRKRHPAINRSVYHAGRETPVFTVGTLTFGILICRDSTDAELARAMVAAGARALFIPTNNGLPRARNHSGVADDARKTDLARATENAVTVIRADVAGSMEKQICHGSSAIVDRTGIMLKSMPPFAVGMIVADVAGVGRGMTATATFDCDAQLDSKPSA